MVSIQKTEFRNNQSHNLDIVYTIQMVNRGYDVLDLMDEIKYLPHLINTISEYDREYDLLYSAKP